MVGGTLYLAGRDATTGELLPDATPCSMCRRLIINSGLSKVVMRTGPDSFSEIGVEEWVQDEE